MAAPPRPATYGLATQLRTPPMDNAPFSPTSTESSGLTRSPQKVTPAMRDDLKTSPRLFTMPMWSTKESPRAGSNDGHSALSGSPHSSRGGRDDASWQTMRSEGGETRQPIQIPAGGKKVGGSLHTRTRSSPQNTNPNRFKTDSPHRPPRPDSPSRLVNTAPLPPPVPRPTETTANGAPIFNKVDFSFGSGQPLDLGIKLDPVYSTYKATVPDVSVAAASPARSEDPSDTPYAAQVRVSVAQRVERGPSFRKGSLAELNLEHMRRGSTATTSSARSSLLARESSNEGGSGSGGAGGAAGGTGLSAPQLRPPRAASPGGTTRPIGQGLRSSYAGSTSSSNGNAAPIVFRRASSVYIPQPSPAPLPGDPAAHAAAPSPLSAPGSTPQAAIIPGTKLPMNLLTLARRTAHISDTPGYAWRLNLLEKLELIMGSFLTVADAEAILSIGNGPEKRKPSRNESRKSQIGMPTTAGPDSPKTKQRSRAPEPKTFFGRMKRALSNPGVHIPKEAPPPLPTSRKAVFGTPLAQVAEYGFVTSMIAGQRHDLPGVTFSTVEEIYRRGQGTKVPGLMQLQGEPGRVAKLIQIYDTAPDYGEHHDLSIESIHNVTSLLKRYLRDLPEPVLDHRLWRLFVAACVDSRNPIKSRVACAQIILRLLPTPNFSLLVYLVAFLSQMPLFPDNKLSLEAVSAIFGSSVMAPRPEMEKQPTRGQMVITGPTESFEALGEIIKKGQEALLWLLNNWSSVADGLLEPDFDIDPSSVLDKHMSVATLNVELPPLTHTRAPPLPPHSDKHLQQAPPLQPQPQQPQPIKPQPQYHLDVQDELRSWAPQKALSPAIEERTLEISSAEQFADVRGSYDSPPSSPQPGRLLAASLNGRAASPVSSRSPRSPQHQLGTPRAGNGSAPNTPSIYGEESGPPTPSKEEAQFFSSLSKAPTRYPSQQRSPSQQHSRSPNQQHSRPQSQQPIRSPRMPQSRSPSLQQPSPAQQFQRSPVQQHVRAPSQEFLSLPSIPHPRSPSVPHPRSPAQQHALPAPPNHDFSREDEDLDEQDEQSTPRLGGEGVSESSPSSDNTSEEPPHMEPSSEASSERSASVVTPRESHRSTDEVEGLRKSVATDDSYRLSGGNTVSILDDVLDYDDNASVYAFPSPPMNGALSRPSPFLPPSPFLTQDEINAAIAADSRRELDSLPPPVNPADYASDSTPTKASSASPMLSSLDERPFAAYAPQPEASREVEKEVALAKAMVQAEQAAGPLSSARQPELETEAEEEEETLVISRPPPTFVSAEKEEDESDLPSSRPPVPFKQSRPLSQQSNRSSVSFQSSQFEPSRSRTERLGSQSPMPWPAPAPRSPVVAADFEQKRNSLPSVEAPGLVPAALLRSKDDQLLEAQTLTDKHRKEVQDLWKKLADLEEERANERKEMHGLRKEVDGFKERMVKRTSVDRLVLEEKKKLQDAQQRAKEKEEEVKAARRELEQYKLEAQHAREEAAKAREEVGALKTEVRKEQEERRKEQADARSTIEALETQISSIRAVLLGGAGLKI